MLIKIKACINITKMPTGVPSDVDFLKNNFGEDKCLPSGPTCVFKGERVLLFVRFQVNNIVNLNENNVNHG